MYRSSQFIYIEKSAIRQIHIQRSRAWISLEKRTDRFLQMEIEKGSRGEQWRKGVLDGISGQSVDFRVSRKLVYRFIHR